MTKPKIWSINAFDADNEFPSVLVKQADDGSLLGFFVGKAEAGRYLSAESYQPLDLAIEAAHAGGANGTDVWLVIRPGVTLPQEYNAEHVERIHKVTPSY